MKSTHIPVEYFLHILLINKSDIIFKWVTHHTGVVGRYGGILILAFSSVMSQFKALFILMFSPVVLCESKVM